ncbi:hypothetical protein ACOMHN_064356 [Nucella lapillus]
MKRVESEAGRECEEKEIGDSYCTDGPTGPEGGEVSSEETNEEGGEGEGDRGLVDGGREVESERSDSTTTARPLDLISIPAPPAGEPPGSLKTKPWNLPRGCKLQGGQEGRTEPSDSTLSPFPSPPRGPSAPSTPSTNQSAA